MLSKNLENVKNDIVFKYLKSLVDENKFIVYDCFIEERKFFTPHSPRKQIYFYLKENSTGKVKEYIYNYNKLKKQL